MNKATIKIPAENISFRVKESLAAQISKCTYTGWNMMKAEEITGSAEIGEVSVKAGGGTSWADEARILPGMWESVIDSQGVRDAEDARNRALGTLQNASMEWQRAEVRCEGDHRIRPGMRVTLKYVGERFSGEYVAERVEHEFGAGGFITEVHLRRNMLPGEPKKSSAIDEERERRHNGGAAKESPQEDAEEQEEEKNPTISNPRWENADGEPITKALVGDEVATLTATVSGGRIECAWKVVYTEDDDDADSEQEKAEKGYTLPEYAFTVECGGVTSGESGQLDVMGWIRTQLKDKETGRILKNRRYILVKKNGEKIEGVSDTKGYISEVGLEHGIYFLIVKD